MLKIILFIVIGLSIFINIFAFILEKVTKNKFRKMAKSDN